jgi:antitoxin CcdA
MRMEDLVPAVQSDIPERASRARQPAKRATNLSLSADVLDAAKALEINVSQTCDRHLREVVRQEQQRRWRLEHADFIAAYNSTLQDEGLPLDALKAF